jgi:ATP-dependent helicase/DNAse subunit B
VIDRVDVQSGVKRIVDYKTGGVKEAELKIDSVEDAFDGQHAKALQLLFYAWLYHKNRHGQHPTLEAEIVSLRSISASYPLLIEENKALSEEVFLLFEDMLIGTIRDILDPEIDFSAAVDNEVCRYCPYTTICR